MNSEDLDSLTINKLRILTLRLNIDTSGGRVALRERLIDFYNKAGWPRSFDIMSEQGDGSEQNLLEIGTGNSPVRSVGGKFSVNREEILGRSVPLVMGATAEAINVTSAISNINIQDIVNAVMQVLEKKQRRAGNDALNTRAPNGQIARGASTTNADSNTSSNN